MERTESLLYRSNKDKLKADGHHQCFICGATENIQTHHMVCPYVRQQEVNYEMLKKVCAVFDVYGYSKQMADVPMTSVDDIRNLINLCEGHHKRADHGVHNVPFADWIIQKIRVQEETQDEN